MHANAETPIDLIDLTDLAVRGPADPRRRLGPLVAPALLLACDRGPATPTADVAPVTTPPAPAAPAPIPAATDSFETSAGPLLKIHPVHHGTFWLEIGPKIVWVDPWSKVPLDGPKADVVLITDIHSDHYDEAGLAAVRKPETVVVAPEIVARKVADAVVMHNGETRELGFMQLGAVPMYNLQRGPAAGKLYHDKGRGNGYVMKIGETRVYVSGDTECTPEMRTLKDIDIAFVCMNLPYTMPPAEAAQCIMSFKPKVVFPYHYRDSNLDELDQALAGSGVEVRRRKWY
jgi:L-ascorbate metabolism protein UlaG (beta-lactamase superfamily)